jgi:O-antigen/teichoic acid export membrane protein
MSFLRTLSAAKPVATLLAGNLLGAFVGGAFFLYASWNFDLAEMGRYSVAISIQWVVVGLLGSGLSTATIRLAAGHLKKGDRDAAANTVFGSLALVVLIGAAAVILLLLFDFLVAGEGYLSGRFLALVALWAVARAIQDITRSGLLAQQRYTDAARITVLGAFTGACALFAVWKLGDLTFGRLLTAHVLGLGTAAVLGIFFLRDLGMSWGPRVPATWPALLRYARWPASSEGTRLLQANMGPLILVPLAGSGAAGLFGVARYPAYLFEVVAVSLYQYWLPEASLEGRDGNIGGYLRKQMLLASVIGLAMVLGAVICSPLLPLLGDNFAAAAPLFVLNAVDFAIFVLTRPIESVFHGLHKPYLELWPRLARIVLLAITAWLFVPAYGALGMVWAHVSTGVVALGLAGLLVWRELHTR